VYHGKICAFSLIPHTDYPPFGSAWQTSLVGYTIKHLYLPTVQSFCQVGSVSSIPHYQSRVSQGSKLVWPQAQFSDYIFPTLGQVRTTILHYQHANVSRAKFRFHRGDQLNPVQRWAFHRADAQQSLLVTEDHIIHKSQWSSFMGASGLKVRMYLLGFGQLA
jgi:hypothetical protein